MAKLEGWEGVPGFALCRRFRRIVVGENPAQNGCTPPFLDGIRPDCKSLSALLGQVFFGSLAIHHRNRPYLVDFSIRAFLVPNLAFPLHVPMVAGKQSRLSMQKGV